MKNGVFQLENGKWGYRFVITSQGKTIDRKRTCDEQGNPFKTEKQALRARHKAINKIKNNPTFSPTPIQIERKTYSEVFTEYCKKGRLDKASQTIRKQDSLWNNHIKGLFGDRYVDEVSVAEVNDYLSLLYFTNGYAYSYVESFLKMFYLILGQAYSRNYLSADIYEKLCHNKGTRIKMPKRKLDEDDDVVTFSSEEMAILDKVYGLVQQSLQF